MHCGYRIAVRCLYRFGKRREKNRRFRYQYIACLIRWSLLARVRIRELNLAKRFLQTSHPRLQTPRYIGRFNRLRVDHVPYYRPLLRTTVWQRSNPLNFGIWNRLKNVFPGDPRSRRVTGHRGLAGKDLAKTDRSLRFKH